MIAAALLLVAAEGAGGARPGGCPSAEPVAGGVGTTEPFHVPGAAAYALNRRGRELYQEQRFDEARAQYRAAVAADPDFPAPLLNVACSYARQERFAEAAREAVALAERAYVPWAREVLEAADLAPLHAAPAMKDLRAGLAGAAVAWGQPLGAALLFVARTRPPVHLRGEGVLHLGLNQEVFAWLPSTGHYRQVTAEDGRVLAFARSADRRSVVYVRAGKLVRTGGRSLLRDLTVRMLDLSTMALGPPVALEGDVERLELAFPSPRAAHLLVRRAGGLAALRFDGETLVPLPSPGVTRPRAAAGTVALDGMGVAAHAQAPAGQGGCRFAAGDARRPGRSPAVRIEVAARSFLLLGPWGAGLFGLPFPP